MPGHSWNTLATWEYFLAPVRTKLGCFWEVGLSPNFSRSGVPPPRFCVRRSFQTNPTGLPPYFRGSRHRWSGSSGLRSTWRAISTHGSQGIFQRRKIRVSGALSSCASSATALTSIRDPSRLISGHHTLKHTFSHGQVHYSPFSRTSTRGTRYSTNTSAIKLSPNAQIPADHTSNREVIQKKLID